MVELGIEIKGSRERERENELIDADLLGVAAVCQRGAKIELGVKASESRVTG